MSLTFEIDPQLSLIAITRSHNPTFDQWREFMEGLLSDARFRPGQAIIEDRRADRSVPTRNDVETAAAWVRINAARLGQIRWAVVLDPAALAAFGMVRVGEFLTDRSGVSMRAFTSIETARAWVTGAATGACGAFGASAAAMPCPGDACAIEALAGGDLHQPREHVVRDRGRSREEPQVFSIG